MEKSITQLYGKKTGPTSMILAGIHGNETCGIDAFKKILPKLKIESGRVIFACGNPRAILANKRFTEANLNRMFQSDSSLPKGALGSYEYKRAQFLKKYFDQADVLLDLHASSIKESIAFIIAEKNAHQIARHLPVKTVVAGFDKIEPGGTEYYMNKNGKIGICVECGYLNGSASTKVAIASIKSFLTARGHVNKSSSRLYEKKEFKVIYKRYLSKTDNFTLAKPFQNFEKVRRGQLVGIDGAKKIKVTKQGFILFAHNCKKIGEEAFLLGIEKNI